MEPEDGKNSVDQWLETGLGQYGKVEPRPGLEGRVLANLEAHRRLQAEEHWNWRPSLAALASLALLGAAIFLIRGRESSRPARAEQSVAAARQQPAAPAVMKATENAVRPESARRGSVPRAHVPTETPLETGEDGPRLTQFPSPQPLSPQEQMLARFVQRRPREARLLAQAQTELLRQDLLEFEKQHAAPERPEPATQ